MNLSFSIKKCLLKKKITTLLLITLSIAAFATLGDDSGKSGRKVTSSVLLPHSAKNFSLRSNYSYQSNRLLNAPEKKEFIMLNPVVTYQKGNTTYVLPLKKMPLMGKITFSCPPKKY
jgi:hypothetical protein